MIQLTEEDVGGAFPGRSEDEARRLARRRALDALAQPVDLGAMGREGEAAQAIGDARSSVEDPRHFAGDVGLRPEDATPPAQGGPADMPAAPGRRVVLTEQDVPPVTASLSQPSSGDVRRTLSPQALTHRDAHEAADVTTPTAQPQSMTSGKDASRPVSARDQEIAAIRRASLARALGSMAEDAVRLVGMGLTGAPVTRTSAVPDPGAGPEQEASALARHNAQAAAKTREGREAEQASARLEREQAASADEMAFRREQLDVMRQRGERGTPTSPLQQAQADRIREEIARHQREMQPDSPESSTARAQYLALVDTLPQGMRGRLMQAIPPERVETMSAAELRAPTARIQAFRERGTAGASGGGSGQAAATREALIRAYRERTGVSEEEAAAAVSALGSQRAAGALTTDALARGRAEARAQTTGEEILPGVTAGVDLSPGEARNIRDGFAIARTSLENLRAVEGVARRYGTSGVISPEARAEMRPRLITMRAMVAQMGNTGVINPTEVPTINAGLPDPTSLEQMTVGDFNAQMTAWRSQLEATIRSGLVARGVDEDGVRTAMTMLHGRRAAARPAAAAAPADSVRVRHPDGRTGTIPRAQLERAQAAGFEVVGGP